MFAPHPISLLQLDTFWVVTALFVIALVAMLVRSIDRSPARQRRLTSTVGVMLQAAGCAAAGIGFAKPSLPWWAP